MSILDDILYGEKRQYIKIKYVLSNDSGCYIGRDLSLVIPISTRPCLHFL